MIVMLFRLVLLVSVPVLLAAAWVGGVLFGLAMAACAAVLREHERRGIGLGRGP